MQNRSRLPVVRSLLALIGLLAAAGVQAQDTIMGMPTQDLSTSIERQAGEAKPPSLSSPFSSTPDTPFKAGPAVFRPRLMYRYINAEGLPAGARRVASEIHTVAPGIQVDLGDHWSLDYAPTWTSYTARALDDTVDQAFSLRGTVVGQEWALTFVENYGLSSPTLVETGQQTEQTTWLTSLGASRGFGPQLGIDLNGTMKERYGEIFPDSREFITPNWLMFRYSPQMNLGLGPTLGYVEMDHGPDITYERYMGRLSWQPTDKISLSASGGMEYRHSRAADAKDLKNPIMDASLSYQPFPTTSLRASYSRSVNSSYYDNQVTVGSGWSVGLEQRLLGHFYFSANWSHNESEYEAVTTTVPPPPASEPPDETEADPETPSVPTPVLITRPGRTDSVDMFNARLTFQFLQRMSFAATYQEAQNRSSQPGYSFNSKQYGFELSCRY